MLSLGAHGVPTVVTYKENCAADRMASHMLIEVKRLHVASLGQVWIWAPKIDNCDRWFLRHLGLLGL